MEGGGVRAVRGGNCQRSWRLEGGVWIKSDISGTEIIEIYREVCGIKYTMRFSNAQLTTRTSVVLYSVSRAVAGFLVVGFGGF